MRAERNTMGVLLLNLGGPDSLSAVRPFLYNLFSDREIIRLGPGFMQKPLAYLISTLRSGKTRRYYGLIGGKSPIREITLAQAEALGRELNASGSDTEYRVYVGMRYWHPFIEEVVPQIESDGVSRVLVVSLYPQYSVATTGSSLSSLKKIVSCSSLQYYAVDSWYRNTFYIDALVKKIREGLALFGSSRDTVQVLFSAHSLPVKFIEEGDPYADQTLSTVREVASKIDMQWHLSYQSKSGPVRWLEPSTESMIEGLARKGVKNVLMVPISFVSDHIETLYEIDVLYKSMAASLGIRLEKVESLNTDPMFIAALKDIVLKARKDAGWAE